MIILVDYRAVGVSFATQPIEYYMYQPYEVSENN